LTTESTSLSGRAADLPGLIYHRTSLTSVDQSQLTSIGSSPDSRRL